MTALIETCRVMNGRLPLKALHDARLSISCRALGIPYPGTLRVPEHADDGVVRLEVSSAGAEVALRPADQADPVSLVISDVAHRPYPHKTTDRSRFDDVLARARLRHADDGLMLTLDGHVAECAIWSVFWWEEDGLVCPPLALGILPGVARARISQLVPLEERMVGPLALVGQAVLVANAARGVVPVASLNDHPVPEDPRTGELAGRFWGD